MIETPTPHSGAPALRKAIDDLGGLAKFARRLSEAMNESIKPQVIANWMSRGVPLERCIHIEKLTGVRCEELNPTIDWKTMREVLCAAGRNSGGNGSRKKKEASASARVA